MLFFELTARLGQDLQTLYDEREAAHLSRLVMQQATGFTRTTLLLKNREPVPESILATAGILAGRLLAGEPWQYITGEAEFFGRTFAVGPGVLIPRPETELLVELALQYQPSHNGPVRVLDACTGSGCIAHSIALEKPDWEVYAFDISLEALSYAEKNKQLLHSNAILSEADLLGVPEKICLLGSFNFLVSNPPYIPITEKAELSPYVREHEPSDALFVPDDDPLLFYKALERLGRYALLSGGALIAETHSPLTEAVKALFSKGPWLNTEVIDDFYLRPRVIQAVLR